jgi:hypothetical protein
VKCMNGEDEITAFCFPFKITADPKSRLNLRYYRSEETRLNHQYIDLA